MIKEKLGNINRGLDETLRRLRDLQRERSRNLAGATDRQPASAEANQLNWLNQVQRDELAR